MSLKRRLAEEIAAEGPLRVDAYMLRCLWDPRDGYYARHPAIGAGGDFLTAPQVSQMCGERLGLWAVQVWIDLGGPAAFRLVELGPGDGTLMADALRAARVAPEFLAAAELVLVEPSEPLAAAQAERLAGASLTPRRVRDLGAVSDDRPLIVLGNEVLDCLPARQFVRTQEGWAERYVGLDAAGALTFVLAPAPMGFEPACAADFGQVVEIAPAQEGFTGALADLVARAGGAALLIDYGRAAPEPGDTLQALRGHAHRDPLADPGLDDLTVWADFPGVLAAASAAGAATAGPTPQGAFLGRLGLQARTEALARGSADPDLILRQAARLVAPDRMGVLFKAVCLYKPGQPEPPGFRDPA